MNFPLNEPQRAAVRYLDGPLLVLAGAGSGKTRVITAKIAHLIERGFDPAHIAAITFTNKAAREMRERALRLLPKRDGAEVPIICTFHALGLRILRIEAAALGLAPRFSILDPGDIESIVSELMATTDRARARRAVADQCLEKLAGHTLRSAYRRVERCRGQRRARLSALRPDAALLSGGGLR